MSLAIAKLLDPDRKSKYTRGQMLALVPAKVYDDGRTKQCFKDQCDIDKIMRRFDETGTISHLSKFEGVYADFSDFDFHEQSNMLARGEQIFEDLPAEIRREFAQSPAEFFKYVNDPANQKDLERKLPALAEPGQQLPRTSPPDADTEAVHTAANEPASKTTVTPTPEA